LAFSADRRESLEILDAGMVAGARAGRLAKLLGVGLSTLQRWRRQFAGDGVGLDCRNGSHRFVSHRLTDVECQRSMLTCHQPDAPPSHRGKSCPSWPARAFMSARSAASTGFSTPMVSSTVEDGLYLYLVVDVWSSLPGRAGQRAEGTRSWPGMWPSEKTPRSPPISWAVPACGSGSTAGAPNR